MTKISYVFMFVASILGPVCSYADYPIFYFDMGAYQTVEGKARELTYWKGHCSSHPKLGESCSISIVGFDCKPKHTPNINVVSSYSSFDGAPFLRLLGPVDFKKRSFNFRILLSPDELTCFVQSASELEKPNLKCTGLDHDKRTISVEIIPKRSTIVEICGDLAIEGRD